MNPLLWLKTGNRVWLTLIFSLTIILPGSLSETGSALLIEVVEAISDYHGPKVSLQCSSTSDVSFFRRTNSTVQRLEFTASQRSTTSLIKFDLTIENEGYFFCESNSVQSSNEVAVAAYPIVDPTIRAQKIYSVPVGMPGMVDCEFKAVGVFQDRYSVDWFKGLTRIDPSLPEFRRYSILSNFSLLITDTEPSDASEVYSCHVSVRVTEELKLYGPTVTLEIRESVRIIKNISDVAVLPGSNAQFTCIAMGVPQPRMKWFIRESEVQGGQVSVQSSTNTYTVQSALIIQGVSTDQTGPVTCVAYHTVNNGDIFMSPARASLIVLTNSFSVTLSALTGGNIRLRASLPATIPGVFTLIVRFVFNPITVSESEIVDPSLKNTNTIDIVINKRDLPDFRQFGVKVAIKYDDNIHGDFTQESGKITRVEELPSVITATDCKCHTSVGSTDSTSDSSNTTISALLSIFIILLFFIVVVGVVLVGFCVNYMYKRDPIRPLSNSSNYHSDDDKRGSLPRSVSRLSYASEVSSHSSRSSSSYRSGKSLYSSHSGSSRRSSVSRAGGDLNNVREDFPEAETESVKHKELSQWGQVESEPVSSPDLVPAINPYEVVTFIPSQSQEAVSPPKSREEVFHSSLPHATNPTPFIIKYEKTKLRNSDSSYEGIELETSYDFSAKVPFKTR